MTTIPHDWIAPWQVRSDVRLILVAEVTSSGFDRDRARPIGETLDFGRLSSHTRQHADLLPYRQAVEELDPATVAWRFAGDDMEVSRFSQSLWFMPAAGTQFLVQLVDFVPRDGIAEIVAALEDMYYGHPTTPGTVDGITFTRAENGKTHQMVILDTGERELDDDEVQRLIYRADLPIREGYTSIRRPEELNRRPGRGAALGPFVTVLWGQQDYIENCAFASVLIGTSAGVVIRDARAEVMAEIAAVDRDFGLSGVPVEQMSINEVRDRLAATNRIVASLENRIALSIDGLSTLMPYIPALRVESYHRALFTALDAETNRETLERMLGRLTELVRVQQEVLDAEVASATDARNLRWSVSVGIGSALAIPVGAVLTFFGINAREIDPHASIFAARYWPLYAGVLAASLAIVAIHVVMYLAYWRKHGGGRGRSWRQ